jgi:hypothetical protein
MRFIDVFAANELYCKQFTAESGLPLGALGPLAAQQSIGAVVLIFASLNIFLFSVGRNSTNFAPPRPRKSFTAYRLVRGSGAKLTEFRPGRGAKLLPGGAKFVRHFEAGASDVQNSPHVLLNI